MHDQVEIQRIARNKLAFREADRLKCLRNSFMATKIQSIVRRRAGMRERKRRFELYMIRLQNDSATKVQSLYRCHVCQIQTKLLAEEKIRLLEEQEKAKVQSVKKDSAIVIQKHGRSMLSKAKCANRRIELGLHKRVRTFHCILGSKSPSIFFLLTFFLFYAAPHVFRTLCG